MVQWQIDTSGRKADTTYGAGGLLGETGRRDGRSKFRRLDD
jgi:hypothetical protein